MAQVSSTISTLVGDDGSLATLSVSRDSSTGACGDVTISNSTPQAIQGWVVWKGRRFTLTVQAHASTSFSPNKNTINCFLDTCEFGWGFV